MTALLLGPALTTLPLADYARERHGWTYVPANLSLYRPQWALPGVFTANPVGPAINGSLWTLYPEVRCYALVVLAGLIGLSRPATFWLPLAAAIAAIFLVPQTEGGGVLATAATLTAPFAFGAAAYVYRRHLPVSFALALLLFGAAVAARGGALYPLAHAAALAYAALWFGFADLLWLRAYNRFGDYSYGMYIYAYPVEQLAAAAFPGIGPGALIAAAWPVTLIFACASWRWIERPALAHRHRLAALVRRRAWRRAPA